MTNTGDCCNQKQIFEKNDTVCILSAMQHNTGEYITLYIITLYQILTHNTLYYIILGPGFNLRALDCCLTLKLCVCFQRYKLNSYEKKISLNLKKSGIFHVFKKSYLAT